MTNKEIAKVFSDLATIMELHGENPFKIRSYSNTYITEIRSSFLHSPMPTEKR